MSSLAEWLIDSGYESLFMRLDTQATLDNLWQEPDVPDELRMLTFDRSVPNEARFLAAEILFHQCPTYPPDTARDTLASVYIAALQEAEIGNPWGLPGYLGDESGAHFVALGRPAVVPLMALLTDDRPVNYIGSREATAGNRYRYRVKDFAAFYLSKILEVPYEVHLDPGVRDGEIERLQASLSE